MTDQLPKFLVQLVADQDSPATGFTVSHVEDIRPIVQGAEMFCVQTDISNISAELVDSLQTIGCPFGVVPRGRLPEQRCPTTMQVASFDQEHTRPGALVERIESHLLAPPGQYHRLTTAADARQVARMKQSIDVFGIVADGRQTYCNLGGLRLHPDFEDMERDVIGPATIRARHWFIQSCHSPFIWPEFGNYRTVPIAIMMANPCTETVICSKRVQVRVPGIADLYVALCLEGRPLGEVVTVLNEYVECRDVDVAPFFLMGDPSCRAFTETKSDLTRLVTQISRQEVLRERNTQLFFYSALTNLTNLLDPKNGLFHDRTRGDKKIERARKTSKAITIDQVRKEMSSREPATSLEDEWNNFRHRGVRPLLYLSNDVAFSFVATHGYYYDVGPTFSGRHYITLETEQVGSGIYRRKELDVSIGVHPAYRYRTRVHTDRDLAVLDVAAGLENGLRCQQKGSRLEFSYTNCSDGAQWVFGCVFCSDPNNLSKSTSRHVYRELMSKLKIDVEDDASTRTRRPPRKDRPHDRESALVFGGKEVANGETYRMPVRLELADDATFFYILIEAFIFVDFRWNWLSLTFRSNCIERWMSSVDYRRSLADG